MGFFVLTDHRFETEPVEDVTEPSEFGSKKRMRNCLSAPTQLDNVSCVGALSSDIKVNAVDHCVNLGYFVCDIVGVASSPQIRQNRFLPFAMHF